MALLWRVVRRGPIEGSDSRASSMFVAYVLAASMLVDTIFCKVSIGTESILEYMSAVKESNELRMDKSAFAALDTAVCSMLFRALSESMICCRAPWTGARIDDAADSTDDTVDEALDEIASMVFEERTEDSSEA